MDIGRIHACLVHRDTGQKLIHDPPHKARGLLAAIVVEGIELHKIDSDKGRGRCEVS